MKKLKLLFWLFVLAVICSPLLIFLGCESRQSYVLYAVTAKWCGPCHADAPNLEAIRQQGGVRIQIYDYDASPDVVKRLNATDLPCYVLCLNGEEVYRSHSAAELYDKLYPR